MFQREIGNSLSLIEKHSVVARENSFHALSSNSFKDWIELLGRVGFKWQNVHIEQTCRGLHLLDGATSDHRIARIDKVHSHGFLFFLRV